MPRKKAISDEYVLLAFLDNGPMTIDSLSETLKVHYYTARRYIQDLLQMGQVEESGSERNGRTIYRAVKATASFEFPRCTIPGVGVTPITSLLDPIIAQGKLVPQSPTAADLSQLPKRIYLLMKEVELYNETGMEPNYELINKIKGELNFLSNKLDSFAHAINQITSNPLIFPNQKSRKIFGQFKDDIVYMPAMEKVKQATEILQGNSQAD